MTPRSLIALLIALAVVAAAATLILYEPTPPATTVDAGPNGEPGRAATIAARADAPVDAADAAHVPKRTEADLGSAAFPGPLARLVGRCVDQHGASLAGCTVRLRGSGRRDAMDKWLRDHPQKPDWSNPDAVVTGDDGQFSFAFWPPPPFRFRVEAAIDGRVAVGASWSSLAPGSSTNLGDVVLSPGVRLRGRVVDTSGEPQADQVVMFGPVERGSPADGTMVPQRSAQCRRTEADGVFATGGRRLPPGRYKVSNWGLPLVSPAEVELSLKRLDESIEVVVKSLAEIPRITGRVVDVDGQPIEGAKVRSENIGEDYATTTDRDGSFDLRAERSPKGKTIGLVVVAEGFEGEAEPRDVAWGSTDVEFRVTRGGVLTICVTDPQQRPIENYAVRLIPLRSTWGSKERHVLPDDGIARLPGLTLGNWLVCIDFPEQHGFDLLLHRLEIESLAPVRLDLIARPPGERSARVLLSDGTPAIGSTVRLCDPFGKGLSDQRPILGFDDWRLVAHGDHSVLMLRESVTAADGRAVLRGPTGRDLALQVTGESHMPTTVEGVRLENGTELVVRTSSGATLRGRAGPPAALEELRRLVNLEPGAEFGRDRPRLVLRAVSGQARFPSFSAQVSSTEQPLTLGKDGAFAGAGVPAGAWIVELHYTNKGGGITRGETLDVGRVTLADGETAELDLDLSAILPGTLEATVRHNGALVAETPVALIVAGKHSFTTATDADGRFTARVIAGTSRLLLGRLVSANTVDIVRGESRRGEFQVLSCSARLHVLDPDGQPVSQLQVMARGPAHSGGRFLPVTDVDGRVTVDLTPGDYTFHALPRRLDDRAEQQRLRTEARAAGRDDVFGPYWLRLGEVTLQAGEDQRVELRLPPEWRD